MPGTIPCGPRGDHWENPSPWPMIIFINLFLNLVPRCEVNFKSNSHGRAASDLCMDQMSFNILFEIKILRFVNECNLFFYWHDKQKSPKPSNMKFHNVTTDQSGVVLEIAAQYDLKKIIIRIGPCMGDGFSRIIFSWCGPLRKKINRKLI